MSRIKTIFALMLETILLFFDRHEHILRRGKRSSVTVFGVGCTACAAAATPITFLSNHYSTDLLVQIALISIFISFLSLGLLVFVSVLWVWESLRYNIDSPLNPLYHRDNYYEPDERT